MGKRKPKDIQKENGNNSIEDPRTIPDLIFQLDRERQVLRFNQAVLDAFGEQDPAMLLEQCNQVFKDLELSPGGKILFNSHKSEPHSTQETHIKQIDRRVFFTVFPLTDSRGSIDGYICTARDIEREEETGIKEGNNQGRLLSLIEIIDDHVWSVDKNYCLTYANPVMQKSIQKRMGRKPQIGESIFWEGMDPGLISVWKENYDRALAGNSFSIEANTLFATEPAYITCQFKPITALEGRIAGVMVHGRDITKHVNAEEILRESEAKYRQLFEAESDSIFLIENQSGRILEANSAAELLYGYNRQELLSMINTDLSSEPEQTMEMTNSTPIDPESVVNIPTRYHRKKDGTIFPVEITGRFFTWKGKAVHIAAIRDITERKQAQEAMMRIQIQMRQQNQENEILQAKLRDLAIRDSLTTLYNRRYMEETLVRELANAKRDEHSIEIIMIDIDNFKDFNDTYGHQNGDLALEYVGMLLHTIIRSGDIACRYGGEEFVIILPHASFKNTIKRAKDIKVQFESMPIPVGPNKHAFLTISLGISDYPMHGLDRDTILNKADQALYKAKKLGKNRVVAYDEGNGTEVE